MDQKYYVHHNGQSVGPYSVAEIVDGLKANQLTLTDFIYDEGVSDWVAFMEAPMLVEGLKALQAKPTAPPKPMAPPKVAETKVESKLKLKESEFHCKSFSSTINVESKISILSQSSHASKLV